MSWTGSRRSAFVATLAALVITLVPVARGDASTNPPIVVIGATAKSSVEIIRQALAAGHDVTGVARRPADVTLTHPRLKVLKGDVYDQASLEAALTGKEVVISMVGPRFDPSDQSETPATFDLFTTGTANIIAAMKKKGNGRLLVASSLGVEDEFPTVKPAPGDFRLGWLWKSRYLYKDMKDMEGVVRASGLDYVIFRPPFLVEEPARKDYKLSVNAPSPKGTMMTYADFGAFVLAQVEGRQYLGDAVGMYTGRQLKFGENADFGKLSKEAKEKFDKANGKQP